MNKCKQILGLFIVICVGLFIVPKEGVALGRWRKVRQERQKKREERRNYRKDLKEATTLMPGRDYEFSLRYDGVDRIYRVHVPSSYDQSTLAPVVFAFHGGGGDSAMMINDKLYNWVSKSDEEGFILVSPNGYTRFRSGRLATWNAGNCCARARDENIDDVGFVKIILSDIQSKLNINPERIFATGMSNGGMFSYRLACDMADTFQAIASVAGTDNYDQCAPSSAVSILHIHAENDRHVLFNGGAGEESFRDKSKVTDFTSVPETIARWKKRNDCLGRPKKVLDVDGAYCEEYSACRGGSAVQLCVTEEGGHSWPGGEQPRPKSDRSSQAIDATDVIWHFFKN